MGWQPVCVLENGQIWNTAETDRNTKKLTTQLDFKHWDMYTRGCDSCWWHGSTPESCQLWNSATCQAILHHVHAINFLYMGHIKIVELVTAMAKTHLYLANKVHVLIQMWYCKLIWGVNLRKNKRNNAIISSKWCLQN